MSSLAAGHSDRKPRPAGAGALMAATFTAGAARARSHYSDCTNSPRLHNRCIGVDGVWWLESGSSAPVHRWQAGRPVGGGGRTGGGSRRAGREAPSPAGRCLDSAAGRAAPATPTGSLSIGPTGGRREEKWASTGTPPTRHRAPTGHRPGRVSGHPATPTRRGAGTAPATEPAAGSSH